MWRAQCAALRRASTALAGAGSERRAAAVFTPDVVEAITAEAKGFYAAKAVVYQTLCHECAAISKVTQYGAPDKNYCEACGKVFESPDLATFQAAVAA